MKFQLRKRHLIPVAAAAVVASGALLFSAGADTVPNGITATEAYSDSINSLTAMFGTPGQSAVGSDIQVPTAASIQFGANSALGYAVTWHSTGPAINPGTGLLSPIGVVSSPATVTFTVEATEIGGFARAVATVTVTQGNVPGDNSVSIVLDTVTLNAPTNNPDGTVTFTTNPANLPDTFVAVAPLGPLPAGVIVNGQNISAGTAVQGDYKLISVSAKDTSGATATEAFNLVVKPFFAGVPVLYGGHANEGVNPSREDVFVGLRNVNACLHFQIVGPGKINGHEGWVPAHVGENEAFYGGLLQHHGYTVNYEAVTGPADCSPHSTTLWPGSRTGYVFFRTA